MAGIITKEKCDDYEYYKQKKDESGGFITKGYRKVWPEDEDLNKKIKCIDDSHSKSKCISEDSLNKLEKDLGDYVKEKGEIHCRITRHEVLNCLKHTHELIACTEEINEFKLCVNKAAENFNKSALKTATEK